MDDERIRERARAAIVKALDAGRDYSHFHYRIIRDNRDGTRSGAVLDAPEVMAAFASAERDAATKEATEQVRELPSHDEIVKMLGNGWKGFKLNDRDDLDFVIGQIRLAIMKCDAIRSSGDAQENKE